VLPEAATAACRDCRAKVEAYTTVGKRAALVQAILVRKAGTVCFFKK